METCTPCATDTVTADTGAYQCVSCSYGFYSPMEGGLTCQTCPKRAAYQPPSCPPIIPNCPALYISNQYGNFTWPEEEPPDTGSITASRQCYYAVSA